jgi:hypothetical protein
MHPARMFGLAFLLCGLLPATGCYYKVQNFGYTREIGIGSVGCQVPQARITWSNVSANQPSRPPEEERSAAANGAPTDKSAEKSGNPEVDKIPAAELPPPVIRSVVPPANSEAPRLANPPPQRQRKGWVGLPDF